MCMCGYVCVYVCVCRIKLKHKNLMILSKVQNNKKITLPTKPYIGSIRNIHSETRNNSTKSHDLIWVLSGNQKTKLTE